MHTECTSMNRLAQSIATPEFPERAIMTTIIECIPPAAGKPNPDLKALKSRQQAAWSSGDYAVIGTTLQIVGERLAESMDLRAGQTVLDVAAGNGNATLAAARRGCEVTSTDYVESLLARAHRRAEAEGLQVQFKVADAENLPFASASFDAVVRPSAQCSVPTRTALPPKWCV
jgi:SAM-dependent methyltransferase